MRKNYEISEYGVIRSKEHYDIEPSFKSLRELYLPKELFNDLLEFIMQNQEEKKDGDRMFSIYSKGKKRQIKTKNYGVIETSGFNLGNFTQKYFSIILMRITILNYLTPKRYF